MVVWNCIFLKYNCRTQTQNQIEKAENLSSGSIINFLSLYFRNSCLNNWDTKLLITQLMDFVFPSQRASKSRLWCFLKQLHKLSNKQSSHLPLILDFITIMWRQWETFRENSPWYNDTTIFYPCCIDPEHMKQFSFTHMLSFLQESGPFYFWLPWLVLTTLCFCETIEYILHHPDKNGCSFTKRSYKLMKTE